MNCEEMGVATMHITTSAAASDRDASSPNEKIVGVIAEDWTEHVPFPCPCPCPWLAKALDWEVVVVVLVQQAPES